MKQQAESDVRILALESSTEIGSVALFEGELLLGHIEIRKAKSHARLMSPMIQQLLENLEVSAASLDAIGVSSGPGSYTGLRVGVSTAKGLCMALDKPLLSLGSLEALAWQARETAQQLQALICPMIDARRMEVYCALYDADLKEVSPVQAHIMEADSFAKLLAERKIIFLGDGVKKCQNILQAHPNALLWSDRLATAKTMGAALLQKYQAGQMEDLVQFEPFYLKSFVATKSKKKYF
ncbi:MAG: tRNA (adenosine(37)-N6)-threonylcarbamoyltransferase complex dimerization subunit type 1 TsaB [Bacteroidota bacterium]